MGKESKNNTLSTIKRGEIANIQELGILTDDILGFNPLEDLSREDKPIPFWSYNVNVKIDSQKLPRDVFYNTVTQEIRQSLELVPIDIRKMYRRSIFFEDTNKTKVLCISTNTKQGLDKETGEIINCVDCKLRKWIGGKKPQCGSILNFVCVNPNDFADISIVRAKSTSLQPIRQFISTYFVGKAKDNSGKIKDLPLFVYSVDFFLRKITDSLNEYAILQAKPTSFNSKEAINAYKEIFLKLREEKKLEESLLIEEMNEEPSI